MLRPHAEAKPVEMAPGIVRRTLCSGDRTTLVELTFEAGASIPSHTHEHEQTGYLVSGRLRFELDGRVREMQPGDAWLVPSQRPHAVTALEPSVAIDVFSPVRTEYLE